MVERLQLIFKVVWFMIAVIMVQDQLRVATLHKRPKSTKDVKLLCHTKKPLHISVLYLPYMTRFSFFKVGKVYTTFESHQPFKHSWQAQQGTITSSLFKLNQ